jgi:hypothetical protein
MFLAGFLCSGAYKISIIRAPYAALSSSKDNPDIEPDAVRHEAYCGWTSETLKTHKYPGLIS